jgi:hypothetical protein
MSAVTSQVQQKTSSMPPGIATSSALSAQELAIESGQRALHGNLTERVLRIFDAIRAYGSPRVTLDRAVHFTESFRTTEGEPLVLRWVARPRSAT